MRILLDTHTLIWALFDQKRLTDNGHELVMNPDNEVLVSIVSAWEIAVKQGLGRLAPPGDVNLAVERSGFEYLPIKPAHCDAYALLPHDGAHRDPFDRMLVVQAMAEGARLLSRDPALDRYGVERVW
ncbi:MAG: type II toxin-antitoxin system VapC family toxin [Alphaproteobacteria bacterium]|jgi:PIN domain nuclease of toxin-antitoxin system|nr:type II toxin-antitoxin system VapC family toxin [Alphaproteobacteria bacterium]